MTIYEKRQSQLLVLLEAAKVTVGSMRATYQRLAGQLAETMLQMTVEEASREYGE